MSKLNTLAVAGAGIGGLATAIAVGQTGVSLNVYEQADAFTEAGAGIGLGPNAMRLLDQWGLGRELRTVGCIPEYLQSHRAVDGHVTGRLPMGQSFIDKYSAPYLTVHRADLHQILLKAVKKQAVTEFFLNHTLMAVDVQSQGLDLQFQEINESHQALALVGADGLHSRVRSSVFDADIHVSSGHWAYRTLLPMRDLPQAFQESHIGIWMGKRLHVVHYPVRGGEFLNIVVLVETTEHPSQAGWDVLRSSEQIHADLKHALQGCCNELQALIHRVEDWRAWCLFDRPPLQRAAQMARGRVALLGDAAHPMLPYLAQGAGMAIEDAACLATQWQRADLPAEQRLLNYAQARWQRVSRVQQRARRNGTIFHADGWLRLARDTALALGGSYLMDLPWLYAG
jgi:salicylate hydroxylase